MKIGVFDSGVGGVTVLKELLLKFPEASFVYLGDTARLPYGTKTQDTIRAYAKQNLSFLNQHKVTLSVIACNSASSAWDQDSFEGTPVWRIIQPGVREAIATSKNGRIGLLATRATVESAQYEKYASAQGKTLVSESASLLVALVEEGWVEDPVTDLSIRRYLAPLLAAKIDTLILGCTHFPVLADSIQRATGPQVKLINPGQALAMELRQQSPVSATTKQIADSDRVEFFVTDKSSRVATLAQTLLGWKSPIQLSSSLNDLRQVPSLLLWLDARRKSANTS